MGKHRADTTEPLPTLASRTASAEPVAVELVEQVEPTPAPTPTPRRPDPLLTPVVAPPALNLAPSSPSSSPIPAPVLTTPRRSRVEVATPTTVLVACWTAVVMWVLHGIGYAAVAVELAGLRGRTTTPGIPAERVDGLLPGTSIAADAGGLITVWTLLAGLLCVGCLVVAALAVVTLKRSSAARIGVITASGAAAALSLGPVFGDGSLWWLVTLLAAAVSGGLLAWDGWWFDDSVKVRR